MKIVNQSGRKVNVVNERDREIKTKGKSDRQSSVGSLHPVVVVVHKNTNACSSRWLVSASLDSLSVPLYQFERLCV